MARASCLYCGAPLPHDPETSPPIEAIRDVPVPEEHPEAPSAPRVLIILDLLPVSAETLGKALELSPYEAELLSRRGGYHLHRILEEGLGEEEAQRLREAGLRVELLPESDARVTPLRAQGGERRRQRLELRTAEGPLTLRTADILLVVRGAITRQYQSEYRRRRVGVASLEEGFRVHFHRHSDARPVEIEATNFEFDFTATGSAHLELDTWIDSLGDEVLRDDGFKRLPPAFGVAEPETTGPLGAMESLGRQARTGDSGAKGDNVVLDNAGQFLFYSGWRAAIERRRAD